MLFLSAALNAWLGKAGVLAAAAVAGFADTHSAAVSVASLVAAGKFTAREAVLPILAGLTTNTITKTVVAISSGGRRYAMQIIPGLGDRHRCGVGSSILRTRAMIPAAPSTSR